MLRALGAVASARGLGVLAAEAGLPRSGLEALFDPDTSSEAEAISRLIARLLDTWAARRAVLKSTKATKNRRVRGKTAPGASE